jgi:hypothetical protein
MKATNLLFITLTAMATMTGLAKAAERGNPTAVATAEGKTNPPRVATAAENAGSLVQSSRHWWQPDLDSFEFQTRRDNEALKRQGFDPYEP